MSEAPHVTTIPRGPVTLHVFASPEVGELVNSLVVETANALVVVDVPLYQPFAEAFRAYVDGLGKPIAKVLITHAHPDHWFTVARFADHPTYAFQEAIDEMAVLKDLAVGFHRSIHPDGDLVPTDVRLPSHTIEPGPIDIDGVTFVLHKLVDVEATATMAVEIPEIRTLLAQDLVYNGCYLYVATKTSDGEPTLAHWAEVLEDMKGRGFELVVPGHGAPSDASLFDANIAYLRFAQGVLATAESGDELVRRFKERYPDHRLDLVLTMSAYMLFPPASA
jgi:glyoxylase-like metal-dependent hydrolase (beta-lactamase superfamily II)